MSSNIKVIILSVICLTTCFVLGIIIGTMITTESSRGVTPEEDADAQKMIMDEISADNIKENLRKLTVKPHIAGRDVNEVELVKFISDRWKSSGLSVEIHPYKVLLSYPNVEDSNYVAIKLSNGSIVSKSHATEAILDPSQDKPGVVNPFNAYSPAGDPEGDLVYVNYGTIDDFHAIYTTIDLSGKICLARYGRIYRGDKAIHAEQFNCSGLILYSDPKDYAMTGVDPYPDSWYLPGTGAQRGSLKTAVGDPLTLHYPSFDSESTWLRKVEDTSLPKIPVTPIGYDDAVKYLENMAGNEVPEEWKGGLNITYRYGPGFRGQHSKSKMKMHITTTNQRKVIRNVIGYIRGSVEPDRYVIIGNHRDAWIFGAMDPSSGTAAMLEISRAYGEAVKNGWKPRRTIVFCSWGGEEFGMIGSTEWVEEFGKVLSSRTVTYMNIDTIVSGGWSLGVSALPTLHELIYESTKLVPNPNGEGSVYDIWKKCIPDRTGVKPKIGQLGSGSDFVTFVQRIGVSSVDVAYKFDQTLGIAGYPVYHSVYETFDFVERLVDPEFKYHQTSSRVVAEICRRLVDAPLLPMDVRTYALKITDEVEEVLKTYGSEMSEHGINIDHLHNAAKNFSYAAEALHQSISDLDVTNTFALRAINDQLMQLDRAFIDKEGITGRDQFSHVIFAPSKHNTYSGVSFPGMVDSMFQIASDPDQDARWEEVKRQYSIILFHIGSAASTLRDFVPLKGFSNN